MSMVVKHTSEISKTKIRLGLGFQFLTEADAGILTCATICRIYFIMLIAQDMRADTIETVVFSVLLEPCVFHVF